MDLLALLHFFSQLHSAMSSGMSGAADGSNPFFSPVATSTSPKAPATDPAAVPGGGIPGVSASQPGQNGYADPMQYLAGLLGFGGGSGGLMGSPYATFGQNAPDSSSGSMAHASIGYPGGFRLPWNSGGNIAPRPINLNQAQDDGSFSGPRMVGIPHR